MKNDPDIEKCMGCKRLKSSKADNVPSASEAKPLSELLKAKPGSWECKTCYIRNAGTADLCVACESPKPGGSVTSKPVQNICFTAVPKSDQNAVPLSELFKPKAGSWECKECYTHNDADKTCCVCCNNPKLGHEVTQKGKTAASSNHPLFKFGMPSPGTEFNFGTSSQITTGQSDFTFGVTAGGTPEPVKYNFGMPISNTSTSATPTTTAINPFLFTSCDSAVPKGGFSFGLPSTTASSVTSIFGTDSTSAAKPFSFEPKAATATFLFGSSSGVVTGNTSPLTFSFGSSTLAETSGDSTPSKDPAGHKFTFGSPEKFEFNFSGIRPKSPTKVPKSPGSGGANAAGTAANDGSGSEGEEDEGEHIYFQPVIPLPDKVPLCTGEEDEDVVYCHRAKLFRFTGGEWKERGVGDIKLLKHRSTHKVRLLMRRDQVLKLCLNHFLKPEMTFVEKDEKTWLWIAPDYSEGHVQEEKFAVRFKNKEIASEFKQAIDKAQADLRSSATEVSVTADSHECVTPPTSLSQEKGAYDSSSTAVSPAMKNFSFTVSTGSPPVQQSSPSTSPAFSLTQLGSSSAAGCARSLFGGSSVEQSVPVTDLPGDRDDVEIVYELKVTPEEEAAAVKLELPYNFYAYLRKPPCPGCVGCENDSDAEVEVHKSMQGSTVQKDGAGSSIQPTSSPENSSILFTSLKSPVLFGQPMPSTTASSTATTQSNQSYSQKLATVTASQQGPLMSVTVTSATTNTWSQFVPVSGSPAQGQQTTMPSVFSFQSSADTPSTFLSSPQTAAQQQSSPFLPQVSGRTHPQQLIASPKLNASITSQTNVTSIFSNPQSSTTAIFSAQAAPLASSQPVSTSPFSQQTSQQTSSSSSDSSLPKTPFVESGFAAFGSKPTSTASSTSCETTKSSGFTFSSAGLKPPSVSDPVEGKPFSLSFGQKSTALSSTNDSIDPGFSVVQCAGTGISKPKHSGFSFGTSVEAAESSFQGKEVEGVSFLPSDTSLSFANLASKSGHLGFKTDNSKNFSWPGAGSGVFSDSPKQHGSTKPTGDKKDVSGDEGCADDSANSSYDPHFEPIVELPDAIEVRTGEEDEIKVFCHRAKLYRYESATKEWKERGVGEMKILHHPGKKTYRLLLRREQVHKVVCNQLVTADLVLRPLSTSDRAWCWGALNYAEENEPRVEELSVRFKLPETAKEFRDKLNECIGQVAKQAAAAVTVEAIKNPAAIIVRGTESEYSDDYSDDEEAAAEEEEDEESERTLLFEKRVTLLIQDPETAVWSTQGLGDLQILYDPDICGAWIYVEQDGTGEQLCNTFIDPDTVIEVMKRDCTWSGMDETYEHPIMTKYMAKFSSEEAAAEFKDTFEKAKCLLEQEHMNPDELIPDED
jgi:E3 SUMO-protein ligase RanBP2